VKLIVAVSPVRIDTVPGWFTLPVGAYTDSISQSVSGLGPLRRATTTYRNVRGAGLICIAYCVEMAGDGRVFEKAALPLRIAPKTAVVDVGMESNITTRRSYTLSAGHDASPPTYVTVPRNSVIGGTLAGLSPSQPHTVPSTRHQTITKIFDEL